MEKVTNILLDNGHRFSGYGFYSDSSFIPNGYGKIDYPDMYVKGNFVNGILNGPAIISHDYFMYTTQMKNNYGKGWGLCINRGILTEFGYYSNSRLVVDLHNVVEWYYAKMKDSGRLGENMLHIYTSKLDGSITDLHIGYSAKYVCEDYSLVSMGFHFLKDGSVWAGHSENNSPTGSLIKFCADGYIKVGQFENGNLVKEMHIQDLIDEYYGTYRYQNDSVLARLSTRLDSKASYKLTREEKRRRFDGVTLDTTKNYFNL